MSGTIALVGGDEFRVGCEEMDREVMRASGRHSPDTGNPASVIIIPTAAVTGPAKAANDGVTHFASPWRDGQPAHGAGVEREANDARGSSEPARDADVVYFTGGNTDHLLTTLRGSMLLLAAEGPAGARVWCWGGHRPARWSWAR